MLQEEIENVSEKMKII